MINRPSGLDIETIQGVHFSDGIYAIECHLPSHGTHSSFDTIAGISSLQRQGETTSYSVMSSMKSSLFFLASCRIEPQSTYVDVNGASEYVANFARAKGTAFVLLPGLTSSVNSTGVFFTANETATQILQRTNRLTALLLENYPMPGPVDRIKTPKLCEQLGVEYVRPQWPDVEISLQSFNAMKYDAFRINDFLEEYGEKFKAFPDEIKEVLLHPDSGLLTYAAISILRAA